MQTSMVFAEKLKPFSPRRRGGAERQKNLPGICADERGFGRKGFIYTEGKALSFIRSYGTAEARALIRNLKNSITETSAALRSSL
jgi:hypothetical protein